MKIIFFGLGSIGQKHARILKEQGRHELFAFRSDKNQVGNSLDIKEIYTWEAVAKLKPDVAFITNPTFLHVKTAVQCANLGMHLFIEKPLSNTLDQLDQLTQLCQQKKLTCYTAYCLRFHPVIQKLKDLLQHKSVQHVRVVCSSYLPNWRQGTDSKDCYSALRQQGGGVLLDLSHEFDYIQYLFGSIKTMRGAFGRAGQVTVDAEDFADIFINTMNNVPINLHLNFLSLMNERKIIMDYAGGYLKADLVGNTIEQADQGQLKTIRFDVKDHTWFDKQIDYFFEHLGDINIVNNLQASRQLLENILVFKKMNAKVCVDS